MNSLRLLPICIYVEQCCNCVLCVCCHFGQWEIQLALVSKKVEVHHLLQNFSCPGGQPSHSELKPPKIAKNHHFLHSAANFSREKNVDFSLWSTLGTSRTYARFLLHYFTFFCPLWSIGVRLNAHAIVMVPLVSYIRVKIFQGVFCFG